MRISLTLSLVALFALLSCQKTIDQTNNIVPQASNFEFLGTSISLQDGFSIETSSPELASLEAILGEEFYLLSGIENESTSKSQSIRLSIDDNMETEAYRLEIDDNIDVIGGSHRAVSMGLVSLLHLMNDQFEVPKIKLTDSPEMGYRSLMIDLARGWHEMGVLKEIIALCKWYKINYLHLHLTDDSSFTFPSTTYPKLATEGRSFTVAQLKELNEYAYQRGVILVPEIDVPGHSSQFINKMPELFGIADPSKNPYTISMGKEEVYDALSTIIGEMADIFTYSPYIHIGGDEAFFSGMEDDPETVAYMKKHELPNLDELFRHFIVRLNEIVKSKGKQTMVWAGFGEEGEIEIPRDIIVVLWESQYYDPQRLLDDGFQVINASFKPLYVVNNRKWSPKHIHEEWNPKRWESWSIPDYEFIGTEVKESKQIMGTTMCVWEQNQINQIHRLRKRLPAMNEHLWNSEVTNYESFERRFANSDEKLLKLLRPFSITLSGRTFPDMEEGNFYEHLWFNSKLELTPSAHIRGLTLRYTLDGNDVELSSQELSGVLTLEETKVVKIQAFDGNSKPIGQPYHQHFFLKPIKVTTQNIWEDLPPGSWDKLRFENEMNILLETSFSDYKLHYTVDGSTPTASSPEYSQPITINKTTRVRAQLIDKAGEAFGSGFSEIYYVIINEPSLTTGKPTIASNEHLAPGRTTNATNGRISLWEMWGGHVDEHVWIKVDLEKAESISKLKVYTFWDNYRYYQYTIDGSMDGQTWNELVDFSDNTKKSTIDGDEHNIAPTEVRYLRINMLYNSANPGLHLVEFNAFN